MRKKKQRFEIKKLKKCPYLILVALSVLIISLYGLLLKFGVINPLYSTDTAAQASSLPVTYAVHNIKAFFVPELNYEPVKFVPPEIVAAFLMKLKKDLLSLW